LLSVELVGASHAGWSAASVTILSGGDGGGWAICSGGQERADSVSADRLVSFGHYIRPAGPTDGRTRA